MRTANCTIEVEKLPNGTYRASCHFLADCVAVAKTADEARQKIETAIAHAIQRDMESNQPPLADGGKAR